VQTVMASFNSWHDVGAGVDYGKMHGAAPLLDEALKQKMGFDGFVISDWNGIGQVKGCSNTSCPQAILAGVDMIMVPDDWKAFIAATMAQVEDGTIPMSRIDDAVTRILRVKMRAGLFDRSPSQARDAGRDEAVVHRELARRAVRESLVLLKNERHALPLRRGQRVLVVGKSADSLSNQAGGWSLTWQGTDNTNADYRNADSILAGLRQALGEANVVFDEKATQDASGFDAVVAVIGETPYAEMMGDIQPWDVASHSRHHPEDLAVLRAAARAGKPVVTVFLSGRPLPVNDLINLSDAFVAAWLPGSEGAGVADVLVSDAAGAPRHDFRGRLSFPWPADPCPAPINRPDPARAPQFALGYGLGYAAPASVGRLPEPERAACGDATLLPMFNTGDVAPFVLHVATAHDRHALGAALTGTLAWPQAQPVVRVRTVQVNTQQDAREVTWLAPARLETRSATAQDLAALAKADGALQFDVLPAQAPTSPVLLSMDCGANCGTGVDIGPVLAAQPAGKKATLKVPLACFAQRGVNLGKVDAPFSLQAQAPFAAAFTRIVVVAGAGRDADALPCPLAH
jgi:beta-glucosidase